MRRGREDDLPGRLAALRRAAELGSGRLPEDVLEPARTVVERAGQRLQLSSSHTVVALAGATGSGKSSLFNAIAGLDLAKVGVLRPTTSAALACVWGVDGAGPLLDWLGIPSRHQLAHESELDRDAAHGLDGLVLLDLPDHDSTTLSHRLEVDRLVGLVDLFVWVVDPQKYADAALHDRYLRPLAGHSTVTLVVLNQADRLTPDELAACLRDLHKLLAEDGIADAGVLAVSARTRQGLHELTAALHEAVARHDAAEARLAADTRSAATRLLDAVGEPPGSSADRGARERLVDALADAAGVPAVVSAVERSTRRRAAAATGWPPTRWVRRLRADPLRRLRLDRAAVDPSLVRSSLPAPTPVQGARVDGAVRQLVQSTTEGAPRHWVEPVRTVAAHGARKLTDRLDQAVLSVELPVGGTPAWWRVAGLVQWLGTAASVVGLGWLVVLYVLAWLRIPDPPTPQWHGWPVPTLLLLGGLLLSLLVVLVARPLAAAGARRRGRVARKRLRDAVTGVADEVLLTPVAAEVQAWRDLRADAVTARGR